MSITFEKLIEKLKNNICYNGELTDFIRRVGFNKNPTHKKDFCVALAKNKSISSLRIECAFENEDFVPLAEAIKQNRHITKITLGHMNNERIKVISDALIQNTSIREIHLHLDYIGFKGAVALGNIITQNPRISIVHLDFNDKIESDIAVTLSKAISQNLNLNNIDFFFHSISVEDFKCITSALASHKTLTHLKLNWQVLGKENEQYTRELLESFVQGKCPKIQIESDETNPKGAKVVADLILKNKSITKLELGCHFDVEGLIIVAKALKENETLKEISFPSYPSKYKSEKVMKEIQQILQYNASRKYRLAFSLGFHPRCGKDSSVYSLSMNKIFSYDPVKLIFSMVGYGSASSSEQSTETSPVLLLSNALAQVPIIRGLPERLLPIITEYAVEDSSTITHDEPDEKESFIFNSR